MQPAAPCRRLPVSSRLCAISLPAESSRVPGKAACGQRPRLPLGLLAPAQGSHIERVVSQTETMPAAWPGRSQGPGAVTRSRSGTQGRDTPLGSWYVPLLPRCAMFCIPTKQKRRFTDQGAQRPLDHQRPAKNRSRMAPAATNFRPPSACHGADLCPWRRWALDAGIECAAPLCTGGEVPSVSSSQGEERPSYGSATVS